jgi:hypothetical protein
VFSMFDFDEDGRLDRNDFKELCSFFMGFNVPIRVLVKLWSQLDSDNDGYVSQEDYVRWVDDGHNKDPNFRNSPWVFVRVRPKTRSRGFPRVSNLLDAYLILKNT